MLLATDLWVAALIRRAEQAGACPVVARRGDARAGAVLVRTINRRAGVARLYAEAVRGAFVARLARRFLARLLRHLA